MKYEYKLWELLGMGMSQIIIKPRKLVPNHNIFVHQWSREGSQMTVAL